MTSFKGVYEILAAINSYKFRLTEVLLERITHSSYVCSNMYYINACMHIYKCKSVVESLTMVNDFIFSWPFTQKNNSTFIEA